MIWLGGSDYKKEGRFFWNDEKDTELRNGYSNWNFGQVNTIEKKRLRERIRIFGS